jgi:hypothetical protein
MSSGNVKIMSEPEESTDRARITREEAKGIAEMYKSLLDAYGQFAETLGRIQMTHEEAYTSMFSIEAAAKLPEMLSEMSNTIPELGKLLTSIFVKLASYLPGLSNLMNLSGKDKIELGRNLKSLARDFGELLKWIEKTG